MTTYTAIPDSDIDPESPGTTTLFTRLRDNPIAIAEGDATAPSILGVDPLGEISVVSPVATVDFQNGVSGIVFDGTYDKYTVEFINVAPATDAVSLYGRVYVAGVLQTGVAAYDSLGVTAPQMAFGSSIGSSAGEGIDGTLSVYNPAGTTQLKRFRMSGVYTTSSGLPASNTSVGEFNSASAIDGLRFYFSSGNIESGVFRLYGIRR